MKFLLNIIILLVFNSILAQNEFIYVKKLVDEVPKEAKKIIENQNYKLDWPYYINDYALIERKGKKTFADKSGKIMDNEFDFRTNMTKDKFFFTAQSINDINDYGSSEVAKYVNIKTFNSSGATVESEISKYNDYYFASNQLNRFKYYKSKNSDYFTIHSDVSNSNIGKGYDIKEGLINGRGDIILTPEYITIKQVIDDYFLVKKEREYFQIINIKNSNIDATHFTKIMTYTGMANVQRLDDIIAFNSKVIISEADSNLWGIYDLVNKKWAIPAVYDEVRPINTLKLNKTRLSSKRVLLTDLFIVRKVEKWGVVNSRGETLIPFSYSKITYNYDSKFNVYNDEGLYNYFDIESKSELFDDFYTDISIAHKAKDIVVLTKNGSVGIYDKTAKTFIIDPKEGYFKCVPENKYRNYKLTKKNEDGKDEMALFSIKNRKTIASGLKNIMEVGRASKFAQLELFDGRNTVIDMTGKEIIPPDWSYYGRAQNRKGIVFFYDRAGKRQKVLSCYSESGEKMDAKACQELIKPKKKKK